MRNSLSDNIWLQGLHAFWRLLEAGVIGHNFFSNSKGMSFRDRKKYLEVDGLRMAYIEEGEGDPVVLLHGNPTSSFIWRNIIPHIQGQARVIAPDLIGMGDSDKLQNSGPGSYRFVEHRHYLDLLLERLRIQSDVVMVGSDWGAALAMDWACRNPQRMKGMVYFEAIVAQQHYDEVTADRRDFVQSFKGPEGEKLMLEQNIVVDVLLQMHQIRQFTEEEISEYRRPFAVVGEGRRPTLTWAREQPWDGEPGDVLEIVDNYADWMASSPMPKLLISGEPGALLSGERLELCRSWPNQREVTVVGLHNLQEDSPDEIGKAISSWYSSISN